MNHFQKTTANKSQETLNEGTSLSAVNALSLARGMSWQEAYSILMRQGIRYGLLLTRPECWKNMLTDAGYIRIFGFRRLKNYADLSDFLMREYPQVTHALIMTTLHTNCQKRICAVRRHSDPEAGFVAMDITEEPREVVSLWLYYEEICAPKPGPDEPVMHKEQSTPSHRGYMYYQPNPTKTNTGDCVIRAYSAVLNRTWEETMTILARSCEYKTAHLNNMLNYQSLASEYGFEPRNRLKSDGKGLTGTEFCSRMTLMCRNGERFFAKVGSDHVVGIIPAVINGEKQYAVADSWDSSGKKIGDYWIYYPGRVKQEKVSVSPKAVPVLEIGKRLIHPVFGEGIVREKNNVDQRVLVFFPQQGEKLLTASWIQDNCREAEDEKADIFMTDDKRKDMNNGQ